MAVEDRYINVNQRVTQDGTALDIFIYYEEEGSVALLFSVPLIDGEQEGVSYLGGDLIYTYNNTTALFNINDDGDLIVNDIDPSLYSINAGGDLILTTT